MKINLLGNNNLCRLKHFNKRHDNKTINMIDCISNKVYSMAVDEPFEIFSESISWKSHAKYLEAILSLKIKLSLLFRKLINRSIVSISYLWGMSAFRKHRHEFFFFFVSIHSQSLFVDDKLMAGAPPSWKAADQRPDDIGNLPSKCSLTNASWTFLDLKHRLIECVLVTLSVF